MAPKNKNDETTAAAQTEEPIRVANGTRTRIAGKLAKPVHLIHDGSFSVKSPAVTREVVVDDPDSDRFAGIDPKPQPGDVLREIIEPEQTHEGVLPKGSKFGRCKVGVAYEITSAQEAADLKARGFREATKDEIQRSTKEASGGRRNGGRSIDDIAAEQREKAQKNLRRTTGHIGSFRSNRDEE